MGIKKAAGDSVTEDEKRKLLDHLSKQHGGAGSGEPTRMTLKRKTTSTLSVGKSKEVKVEVRKKRTYVKRTDVEEQRLAEEEAKRKEEEARLKREAEERAAEEARKAAEEKARKALNTTAKPFSEPRSVIWAVVVASDLTKKPRARSASLTGRRRLDTSADPASSGWSTSIRVVVYSESHSWAAQARMQASFSAMATVARAKSAAATTKKLIKDAMAFDL